MTIQYPQRPRLSETAPVLMLPTALASPTLLAVSHPDSTPDPATEALSSLSDPPSPGPSGEIVRHILIGSPEAVRDTVYRLHMLRYVEHARWTGPVKIGPQGVQIPHEPGQVLYYLMRLRSLDAPA